MSVRNLGRAFASSTMRTDCACFGRSLPTADFNAGTTMLSEISNVTPRHKTKARPLNPRKISAYNPTTTRSGFQISMSLIAAMNKSSGGLVHRWLIR